MVTGRYAMRKIKEAMMDDDESDLRIISIKRRINALGRTEWPYVLREVRDKLEEP